MKPFNWAIAKEKAINKSCQRTIHECRTNPQYQREYPNEAKQNPERKVFTKPHPEAAKRITQKLKLTQNKAQVPIIERPPRLNKIA